MVATCGSAVRKVVTAQTRGKPLFGKSQGIDLKRRLFQFPGAKNLSGGTTEVKKPEGQEGRCSRDPQVLHIAMRLPHPALRRD